MKAPLIAAAALLFGFDLAAQNTVAFQSVGTAQVVPSPATPAGPAGIAALFGYYAPATASQAAAIRFVLSGVPVGYNTPQTTETIWFLLDLGFASVPGTPLLGGALYAPLIAPQTLLVGTSSYLGPQDVVPSGGTFGGIQSIDNNGRRLDLSGLFSPLLIGVNLNVQAALVDSVLNRVFTSNALNFQIL